jgi:hypothetical protein
MYTLTSVWLVTQFEGLELPVLALVNKTQTLFGSEFGTGFESGTETKISFRTGHRMGFPVLLICGTGIGT